MNPPTENELFARILESDPTALAKAADAGSNHIRTLLRQGLQNERRRRALAALSALPEGGADRVVDLAREFARLLLVAVGLQDLREVDARNRAEPSPNVCHSHDFCDANVFMDEAHDTVLGWSVAARLPAADTALWDLAWEYAKLAGFVRLAVVKGTPDVQAEVIRTAVTADSGGELRVRMRLPGMTLDDFELPLIDLDFYGRDPRLQIVIHGAEMDEPAVHVRFDGAGRVVEVLLGDPDVLVRKAYPYPHHLDATPSLWEEERDANPPCAAGERLRCPSGQIGTVMRLRDRYASVDELRTYDETYGILERLGKDVYNSAEQAWDIDPLTVGTANPADFSFVPELQTPSDDAAPT